MAFYETANLEKVIVASGTIYDNFSQSAGDVYSGDMRENVGKAQVSTGINLADYGIPSTQMNQVLTHLFNRITIHHSVGKYSNGIAQHGLSGGNQMATLISTQGNELSHELGHVFSLGHYPGANFTSPVSSDQLRTAVHHSDRGWRYISTRGLLRANVAWSQDFGSGSQGVNGYSFTENFKGLYLYNRDAMSGGWDASDFSKYTHMTGYSIYYAERYLTASRVDNGKDIPRPIPDISYPSGYKSWVNGTFWDTKVIDSSFNYLKPNKIGVPVFTLLGGYNPFNFSQSLMYNPFRSNYGNIFILPGPNFSSPVNQCYIDVQFYDNKPALQVSIDASSGVKQFQVNIEESINPRHASIFFIMQRIKSFLTGTVFPQNPSPLKPPVVVGQNYGFEALRAAEISALDTSLSNLQSSQVPVLSDFNSKLALKTWKNNLTGLSSGSLNIARKILDLYYSAKYIEKFVVLNRGQMIASNKQFIIDFWNSFRQRLFSETNLIIWGVAQPVTVQSKCLQLNLTDKTISVIINSNCTVSDSRKWFIDSQGYIRSIARVDLCLTSTNGWAARILVKTCQLNNLYQQWTYSSSTKIITSHSIQIMYWISQLVLAIQ